jgi:6-phosphogluconolactonase (cycloisomerase 2 family)
MSKRWAWLLGAVLVLIGFLLACGSVYNHASDGLVVVTSQGSMLLQSYSFSLASGSMSEVSNSVNDTGSETCVLPGIPGAVVIDPAGQYAYVTLQGNAECPVSGGGAGPNGIQAFKINSDGTVTATGSLVPDPNPTQMVIDSSGKYLFVAEGTGPTANYCQTALCVDVYAIGSGASLTAVPQTITQLPTTPSVPNLAALVVSPTVFPGIVNGAPPAVCSTTTPPTAEYLYVVDSTNYLVWQFGVNAGVLGFPGANTALLSIATGTVPAGIAIDPCDRFVYVSNNISNKISAYSICNGGNTQNLTKCPSTPDGSLYPIAGSPFSNSGSANYPGPLIVDAYGNFLYVLNGVNPGLQGGNSITPFRISAVSGSIQPLTPAIVSTGAYPKSIAIRGDDTWLFVTNFNPPTLSQYSVTPATGTLTPVPQTIPTDNYPFGIAVK